MYCDIVLYITVVNNVIFYIYCKMKLCRFKKDLSKKYTYSAVLS